MVVALPTTNFLNLEKSDTHLLIRFPPHTASVTSTRKFAPMAALAAAPSTVGLAETFSNLKKQGKVIPYITAGDPGLSTTAEALKVLDSCGADIIELGVPYSDPLADGPVIKAATTCSLAKGTNFNAIQSMLREVRPPGHHAGVRQAMGFCLHNNAAVAALAAQAAGTKKVILVDWDVHHGNGTQEIFDQSKSVFYISLHRHEGGT